jgi:hypothetical protein
VDERLTDDEVARVLRRASELDADVDRGDGGMPVAAVEAAAAEVGLSPAAVRQAVAELRTGALEDAGARVVCARVVPGTGSAALYGVGDWLKGQAMVCVRDRGGEQVWRPREDVFARIQRRLDWAARIRLRAVDEVLVRAVDVEGGALVRVSALLESQVGRAPAIGAGAGGVAGFAALAVAASAVSGDAGMLVALGAAPAAGAGGVVGWRIGRGVRQRELRRISEAVEGLLDALEKGRPGRTRRLYRA